MRELDACGVGFVADRYGRSSRDVIEAGLEGLAGVRHRGAVASDARTSDGCGILVPLAPGLFGESTGVANLFVRGDDPRAAVEELAGGCGLEVVGWRTPPTHDGVLGDQARTSAPQFLQALLAPAPGTPWSDDPAGDAGELAAFRLRRRIDAAVPGTYAASCSFRTVVYKGLAPPEHLADFYPDLADPRTVGHFALFHQRFSTNTLPTWERAQPFRLSCHNGEINTIWGNVNRLRGRGQLGTESAGLGPEEEWTAVMDPEGSDSGQLDEVVELLVRAGRRIGHAMAMVMPEAWEESRDLDPEVRGFYHYHSALMEPWDGPAAVLFTDGRGVGAALDRNGLRPLRFAVCEDGLVVCCSEMGAVRTAGRGKVERGRLGPGHVLFASPDIGVVRNHAIKEHLAAAAPYATWAAEGFRPVGAGAPLLETPEDLPRRQVAAGFTREDLAMVLKPMASDAYEPTFSMGDDSPLPSLAGRPRPVAHYLRQRFAQVTNPAIDPLRERRVMSLRTLLGPRQPLLEESAEAAHLLELDTFFLYPSGVAALYRTDVNPFPVSELDATFPVADGPAGLPAAVARLADAAVDAVSAGTGLIVLDAGGPTPERAATPSLLALGGVHQRLTRHRLRSLCSVVVVADDVLDVHGVAALLGYGADAVCPRLALQTVAAEADESDDDVASPDAQERYQVAVEAGVLKVMSKMGISTVDSYRGAQTFEVVGFDREVVDACFTGTTSTLGGIGWEQLGLDVLARHAAAHPDGTEPALESPGYVRVRKGGEAHTHSKEVVQSLNDLAAVAEPLDVDARTADMAAAHLLQRAIAAGSDDLYRRFADLVDHRAPAEPHDLLEIDPDRCQPIDLAEVEPASAIVRRFSTGAMSHGSLSREAHENLARAMNLIGGMSNCGEGGEDPARFRTRGLGRDDRNSRIKQVASGRFGVTPEYLAHAEEIQIKVAQGSKPGEGGQLPGHKVSREIARLRHTQPGVGLISPPPHHDIYSIEDLAQLIFDLKQVNAAVVSVKLVAEDGVGTVAAGVVKALADVVHISGHNGGTGASPLSAIKHAGLPWELGLADAQRALAANGLRSRARLRVDGGFKTGRQVVTAALLGADEYSFGTAAMIAEGCIMLRACHRDTCKPGVATQRPNLRANFTGTPEGVATYFLFVAEQVRRHLASIGARSLDEVVGRTDLLRARRTGDPRADAFDLTPLLAPPPGPGPDDRRFVERVPIQDPRDELGDRLLADAFRPVWDGDEVDLGYAVTNADRAVGAALSGAIALEFGALPPLGTARARFDGAAGQSFGAFLSPGVELELVGEANDYVGKGMAGGRIVVRPPDDDLSLALQLADEAAPDEVRGFAGHRNDAARTAVLAGNTCLYGATGGELFVAGGAGERFAVRNSGALAIVEAVGDHCCEYMTGGTVVVLGRIGHNLGAGMTGGQAFVWDPSPERVTTRVNPDLVEVLRPDHEALEELRWLVERHRDHTASPRARALLAEWDLALDQLWHVVPRDRGARIADTAARRVRTA